MTVAVTAQNIRKPRTSIIAYGAATENRDSRKAKTIFEKFDDSIAEAKSAGAGYRAALNDALSKAYAALYIFENASAKDQETLRKNLEQYCSEANLTITTGKTKPEHMIVKLAFGELLDTTTSQRARLLRLAINDEMVKPAAFKTWLAGKGGIVKALLKTPAPDKQASTDFAASVTRGRTAALKTSLGHIDNTKVRIEEAARPKADAPALAIITAHPDGSFSVRAFVQDDKALDAAYAAYGKTI